MNEKKPKYRLEKWKRRYGYNYTPETAKKLGLREDKKGYYKLQEKLVCRESNGQLTKNKPVIDTVRIKNYGSGVYRVGVIKDKKSKREKIIIRQKISEKNLNWWENRKEVIGSRKIYRTSYVLHDVPLSVSNQYFNYAVKTGRESWTIGFRINAFSRNKNLLTELKQKLKDRLIKFIEDNLKYRKEEWWFSSYFGYEAPTEVNAFKSENGKFYLTIENIRGTTAKTETHYLNELL